MSSNDSIKKTLIVAFSLCIVCSVVVSTAAVMLKPAQVANAELDRKKNILAAAGILEEGRSIDEQFESITTRAVDLRTGQFTDEVDAASFNQRKSIKDPALSDKLSSSDDPAKILRREHFALVYMVEDENGLDKIILPIRGYGLWGTLYGFVALEGDMNTVAGLGFYEHKETPGLGGEVDNPRWKGLWPGKQMFADGEVALTIVKGAVDPGAEGADFMVDGLAGATLTTRGLDNLVKYWLGPEGFMPFLSNLKSGEA
ncbi:Na(+)-translocating NADH-quinone reductase subunit C [Halioglobus japonicus]|uniref:Na(+)-translocating NADH-quinone reductase subunit C n=1 Tax=Halioglobus japonicus TaxID=930805 RepID=A0AAP8MFA4_9GAMM|nr:MULTISPECIES: Na(+)-translocating NADH-quinone reductase subunit C [Halioglobus]AQA18756.1 Na(+)-translocating NADH-quinone reductase subunit C [Halioglobus japonicus]KZX60214.1 NADH:ubiquinone reductase (Na(+)-transporting) subunit C [Halioglobus sp. HI00S01]PLW86786.1 Na(+)-translocating NADH-quinone reductase subunit C [Halioglobus japonicus]GHD11073.1 Na(+)-translocating NADH-quinone reductase subunit C [Halioglobus japonicus]